MIGGFPNPAHWFQLLFNAQKAQMDVAGKVIEASQAMLDPERVGEARELLDEAKRKALDEAEAIARAQWEWLSQWRC